MNHGAAWTTQMNPPATSNPHHHSYVGMLVLGKGVRRTISGLGRIFIHDAHCPLSVCLQEDHLGPCRGTNTPKRKAKKYAGQSENCTVCSASICVAAVGCSLCVGVWFVCGGVVCYVWLLSACRWSTPNSLLVLMTSTTLLLFGCPRLLLAPDQALINAPQNSIQGGSFSQNR